MAIDLSTAPGHDVLWRGEDLPSERSLDCKVGYDDCIFGVLTPSFKQLSGEA